SASAASNTGKDTVAPPERPLPRSRPGDGTSPSTRTSVGSTPTRSVSGPVPAAVQDERVASDVPHPDRSAFPRLARVSLGIRPALVTWLAIRVEMARGTASPHAVRAGTAVHRLPGRVVDDLVGQ